MMDKEKELSAGSVYIGAFNAESYWREETLARLPAMDDEQAKQIVLAMDEMQFVFCKQGDVLITRFAMDDAHQKYLREIGFNFIHNKCDVIARNNRDKTSQKSVFQLLAETEVKEYYHNLIPPHSCLSPFAVIPFADAVSLEYHIRFQPPPMDIIRKVNSKLYSTQLRDKLGIASSAKIVNNSAELRAVGTEMLKDSPFLIKDAFGVSGKGNLFVNSEVILQRIAAYLTGQEEKEKRVQFILEPFLEKETDFSCQFFITKSGEFRLTSIQSLVNSGFSYLGTFSIDREFRERLEREGYLNLMERLARELYHDGYNGDVCVDSMLLKDGSLVPIVEINARKSMSLFKHAIDQYLGSFSLHGNLTYIAVSHQVSARFDELLAGMKQAELLFGLNSECGIIPLTANTLFINRDIDVKYVGQRSYKGRVYFSAVAKDIRGILDVTNKMKSFMEKNGFKIEN